MAEEKKKPAKADKPKKPRRNPLRPIVAFFKSVNAERRKVVWPTAKETVKNAAIVLVVAVIVGVAIYVVDTALSEGMKLLRNAAPEKTTISDTVDDETAEDEDAESEDAENEAADGEDEDTADTEGDTADDATEDNGGEDE